MQSELAQLAEGLELTVDYGVLWFLAKPLFWCLERLYGLTGNWGWSIILVTILLKLVFYHLSAAGYRSMANMRRVQPRIVSIRDRYKDDRARLNQAMMQIYKEEKINPFGGCFPILVQIPVFLALYWVLLESVELRQADFIFWLNDLSSKDPFFVPADHHGHNHVDPAEAQPRPDGSHAGESNEGPAFYLHGIFRILPIRAGVVLGHKQHPVHCPAMAYHEKPGKRGAVHGQNKVTCTRGQGKIYGDNGDGFQACPRML